MKSHEEGLYEINSDAIVFSDRSIRLDGIVRDSIRDVVVATCTQVSGSYMVEVAKAMALRQTLKIALEAAFSRFVVEMDNIKLYSHLNKGKTEPFEFGSILEDIYSLALICNVISFSFVRRQGNNVANCLAKPSCSFNGVRV